MKCIYEWRVSVQYRATELQWILARHTYGAAHSSYVICKVTDLEDMAVKMEYYLEEYNVVSSSPMSLVMFRYALDHISRCARVLLQDNGTVLHSIFKSCTQLS